MKTRLLLLGLSALMLMAMHAHAQSAGDYCSMQAAKSFMIKKALWLS